MNAMNNRFQSQSNQPVLQQQQQQQLIQHSMGPSSQQPVQTQHGTLHLLN